MRKTAVYGTVMVFLTTLLHAVSHFGQEVLSLEVWQWEYVIGVIYLAQIAAGVALKPHSGFWAISVPAILALGTRRRNGAG